MRPRYERRTTAIVSAAAIGLGSLAACSSEAPTSPRTVQEEHLPDCNGKVDNVSELGTFQGISAYKVISAQHELCAPITSTRSQAQIAKIYPEDVRAVPGPPIFACAIGQRVFAAMSQQEFNAQENRFVLTPFRWGLLSVTNELAYEITPCPPPGTKGDIPSLCPIPDKEEYMNFDAECIPVDPSTKV